MATNAPVKVLITGGHEIGGVGSVAAGLATGFAELGLQAEVIRPAQIFSRLRELRDPGVLKILSTTAVFAAPFARRAICVAHGVPCAEYQGYDRLLSIVASFKLANMCAGTQLVAVSQYTAEHLRALFRVEVSGVIINPIKPVYLQPCDDVLERSYITYVGRLTPAKNLHRLLPIVRDMLDELPELRMCIVGDGPQRALLEAIVEGDSRFEFKGNIDDLSTRDCLRRTRIFVSGNVVEGLGITYLEALSQGCAVVMPACGGGVEIALEGIGKFVHLLPLSFERQQVLSVLRRASLSASTPALMHEYSARSVAAAYLQIDSRFSCKGELSK